MNIVTTEQISSTQTPTYSPPLIPMLEGETFHMTRDYFKALFNGSVPLANLLRGMQVETEKYYNWLRRTYEIPADQLPAKIDCYHTMTEEGMEQATHGAVKRSSCGKYRGIMMTQYGMAHLRRIVRVRPDREIPHVAIYVRGNETPYFILGDPENEDYRDGDYRDADGNLHNLCDDGYLPRNEKAARRYIEWQVCLEEEKIISSLYRQRYLDPPEMPKRASPLTRVWEPEPPRQKEAPPAAGMSSPNVASSAKGEASKQQTTAAKHVLKVAQGDTSTPDSSTSLRSIATVNPNHSDNVAQPAHKSTPATGPKLHRDTINPVDLERLKDAPRTTQTVIDLLSLVLPIPARETVTERWWNERVLWPCEWIDNNVAVDLSPRYFWEDHLFRHAAWHTDPNSGSWWATSPKAPSVKLPCHLVGRDEQTWQPTGKNWQDIEKDMGKVNWHPMTDIEYYGPVIVEADPVSYQDGYIAQDVAESRQDVQEMPLPVEIDSSSQAEDAPSESRQECHTDEIPVMKPQMYVPAPVVPLEGMTWEELDALAYEIRNRLYGGQKLNKDLLMGYDDLNDGSYYLVIEYAKGRRLKLKNAQDWQYPAPVVERMVEAARKYADSLKVEKSAEEDGHVMVAHPEHSFLFLDDMLSPTILYLQITGESELEDDRRCRIAQEVKWQLAEQGYHVVSQCIRDASREAVEA